MVVHAGFPGTCYSCDGRGEVEGDAATIAAAKARSKAVKGIIRHVTAEAERRGLARHNAALLSYGLDHLATHEPARYEAALASFQAGHPRLTEAVVAYTAEAGYLHYGTRKLSADEAVALLS